MMILYIYIHIYVYIYIYIYIYRHHRMITKIKITENLCSLTCITAMGDSNGQSYLETTTLYSASYYGALLS